LAGTPAAAPGGPTVWWPAAAALVVAVALQGGVNYANDYSDGLRGADTPARLGPGPSTPAGPSPPGGGARAGRADGRWGGGCSGWGGPASPPPSCTPAARVPTAPPASGSWPCWPSS